MNQQKIVIVAHSYQQYAKCQGYLKGHVALVDMYPMMITYYSEIMKIYRGGSINHITDDEIAKTFCENMLPPKN